MGVSNFQKKNVAKVYDSLLLVLQLVGWVSVKFPEKKRYATLAGLNS